MFYDQQFRLGVDKHHLPKKQSAVSAKAEVACEISESVMLQSTFGQCWMPGRECSCEWDLGFAGGIQTHISCVFMTGPGFNFLGLTKSGLSLAEPSVHLTHFGLSIIGRAGHAARDSTVWACFSQGETFHQHVQCSGEKDIKGLFLCWIREHPWCLRWGPTSCFTCWWERGLLAHGNMNWDSSHTHSLKPRNFCY